MSLIPDDCERCGRGVDRQGDHTCTACAKALDRDVRDPFWGAFAGHSDSRLLTRLLADVAGVARDLARDLRGAARDFAHDLRAPFEDAAWLRRERRRG